VAATNLVYTSFERGIVAWLCILVGAWFLFRATVNKRQKNAMKELLGVRIDKIKFFRNYFSQRLEGMVGFAFVLIGVGIHLYVIIRQAQAYEAQNNPQEALRGAAEYLFYAIVALVVITVLMQWICSYFSRRIFLDLLGYLMVRYDYRVEEDPDLLMQIGDLLGVARADDDTVESYTHRIEDRLRLRETEAELKARGKKAARRFDRD
jgi:hypothetical protein